MATSKPRDVKVKYFTGGEWKAHIISRKGKESQTPGKKKGETCQADYLKKFYAKRSRSYKDVGYSAWCDKMSRVNLGGERRV